MVCRTGRFPVVDLFTFSRELQDRILREYEWVIMPEQHLVDSTGREHLFCFYNLFGPMLGKFLSSVNVEYELRSSYSGEFA